MLEKDFAERYRAAFEREQAPAALAEATLELMADARSNAPRQTIGANSRVPHGRRPSEMPSSESMAFAPSPAMKRACKDGQRGASSRNARAPKTASSGIMPSAPSPDMGAKRRRWMAPVAACLAALLVLFGAGAAFLAPTSLLNQPQARAYAKTPNLLTADIDSGIIPFALDEHLTHQGGGLWTDGIFSAMRFTMAGENVARIQATISRGELCLVTTETLMRCDPQTDPEQAAKLDEVLNWSLSNRGTGAYYADYDHVSFTTLDPSVSLQEYEGPFEVTLIKRIGSTINIPYEGEPLTFCFWYSTDDITFYQETSKPQLVALNGDELTITTQFTNGAFRTQTIVLHDGWFAWSTDGTHLETFDSVLAQGPFKTYRDCKKAVADSDPPYQFMEDTLFGEVTSVTDAPHPFPLENANASLSEPIEPHIVTLEDTLGPTERVVEVEGTPPSENIKAAEGDFAIGQWSYERNGWADLHWSDLSAFACQTLPANMTMDECTAVISFQGNIDYMNRCRMATNNWSVSADGRLNDDNSFVVVDVTVTNAEDEPVLFSAKDVRGTLCAVDKEANATTFAAAGVFGAKDDQGRLWGWSASTESYRMEPGESTRLRIICIADNAVAEADEVLFTTASHLEFDRTHVRAPKALADTEFISLGKLERK